ncbi:hypothetical protein NDU88_001234 [Pleurodeles waltl]|uniref:CCHC-type domain-containing protein n=1 Tax=Pleurodeles waltl TaxID=8319 RepID=A0AAV7M4Q4_PLEWA|nr:hypothetical protein NDU88_001234 [Pleurodeles waltl]
MRPLQRPAQFEALAVWELVARQQHELKTNRRIKKIEKTQAEARWDWEQKRWRMATMKEVKMFPAIMEGDDSDKGDNNKERENEEKRKGKKSYVDDDDSDVEDYITQLLRDRPPPMITYAGGPGNIATAPPATPGTSQGAVGAVQTEGGQIPGVVQSKQVAGTRAEAQVQVPTPSAPVIYPNVPTLETVSNIVVPREQANPQPILVQTDPTPMLLPRAQIQNMPRPNQLAGTSVDLTPVMNQAMGVPLTRSAGSSTAPDAISLLITVGPAVPLYAQKKSEAGGQIEISQNLGRRGAGDSALMTSSSSICLSGLKSPVGFSPLVALPDANQSMRLLTPQAVGAGVQQLPVVSVSNISLQGLTTQQLNSWLDSLSSSQGVSKGEEQLNRVGLNTKANELVEGTMGLNMFESYNEEELRYLCLRITKEVGKIHQKLAEVAEKHDIDLKVTKHLRQRYRLDFEAKYFENMRSAGMEAHLRDLLQSAQIWGALKKREGRWAKRKDKQKRDSEGETEGIEKGEAVKMLPMREIPGGQFVHVPWHRSDILSFTNDYPKLREKPVEWYQQTEWFVKLSKCLWEALNTLFEIVVPADLWVECKRAVDCPTSEPARHKITGAPSPGVKLIDEVLQYAKYCNDEIELKQKKLKEKAMVMQIKAAQSGVQGALVALMPPQQRAIAFQPQVRGRGCGMDVMRGPDLNTVVVQNDMQGMKRMLPCHLCGNVGHWKRECPLMVQEGMIQQGHNLKAGDWVVIKKHLPKTCLEPRWRGTYQVVLTTTTAVKCAGLPNWLHASHTKKVVSPQDQEEVLLSTPASAKRIILPEPEPEQVEPEVDPQLAEEGSITPVRDEGVENLEAERADSTEKTLREPCTGEVLTKTKETEKH